MKFILLPLMFSLAMNGAGSAQVFDEKFEHWPEDLKINGRIIVAGELVDPGVLSALMKKSDSMKTTAVVLDNATEKDKAPFIKLFSESKALKFFHFPTTEGEIEGLLDEYDVVIFQSSEPLGKDLVGKILRAKSAFATFIDEGKLLMALGSAAEIVSQSYFNGEDAPPDVMEGLDLLPDCVLEVDFDGAADQKRLLAVLAEKDHSVGIGLDEGTALLLSGRRMRVVGAGEATFLLKGNERESARIRSITAMNRRSRDLENILLDLTQWRRDAIDRSLPRFPAEEPRKPFVENGTLIIVGGGGSPRGMTSQFIRLAGGVENARLVYVPCSEQDDVGEEQATVRRWKRAGVKHATFIHTKDRNKANSDGKFLEPLKHATGIYFGGGRQWNFSDSYYGTEAHRLMKEVLMRGGVIAGSSAGASIQGRYLARATPIGNSKIMAFGYERGGLGFLDGVAIDQHFTQRNRFRDMSGLVEKYPQLLGIGIDESTAIVVRQSKAKVIGRGKVHFYDRNRKVGEGEPGFVALAAGSEYDLAEREVIGDKNKPAD